MNLKKFKIFEINEGKDNLIYLNLDENKIVALAPIDNNYMYIYFKQNNNEDLKEFSISSEDRNYIKASFRILCKSSINEILEHLNEGD